MTSVWGILSSNIAPAILRIRSKVPTYSLYHFIFPRYQTTSYRQPHVTTPMDQSRSSSYTDLLIIGAGPAGLTAACWASQYSSMSTRIIDEKNTRTETDGIHSRTMEKFESFGIVDENRKRAVDDIEMCYWVWCPFSSSDWVGLSCFDYFGVVY